MSEKFPEIKSVVNDVDNSITQRVLDGISKAVKPDSLKAVKPVKPDSLDPIEGIWRPVRRSVLGSPKQGVGAGVHKAVDEATKEEKWEEK